jgi:hypothetical protein
MAPIVATNAFTATFTAAAVPTNADLGTVTIASVPLTTAPAPLTSVALVTPIAAFGGDNVTIQAGPGGDFGSGVYAITRGHLDANGNLVGTPGVIYRIDPATGRATTFFDLNTVVNQLEPGANASNSLGNSTGFVNWYSMTFDAEGIFDGKPSLFVSSVDRTDPAKNIIFRIAPDGSFLGAFVSLSSGQGAQSFDVSPTSILIPPAQQQSFLRGLFVGNGVSNATTNFAALFFDANVFPSGTNVNNVAALPAGVDVTPLTQGPQVGLTAANTDYFSPVYSAFTDFGTPGLPYDPQSGGIPARPGLSGVQGLGGEFLIPTPATPGNVLAGNGYDINTPLTPAQVTFMTTQPTATVASGLDQIPAVSTPFRRFQSIAFDQYGYFSNNFPNPPVAGTVPDPLPYAGAMFVSDLATGLAVSVTPINTPAAPAIPVPIQGPGTIGVQLVNPGQPFNAATNPYVPIVTNGNTTDGSNLGGRILRIEPNGTVTTFAYNFNTSRFQNSTSFIQSSLSITFSNDGTILYASDGDGIWEFKTVTDLASSTSGSITGLNDLRSLGVPYDGQNSAVAVLDTGVDATNPAFKGQVSTGQNVVFNGPGNQDLAGLATGTTATTANSVGHGTPIAGVIAQFVPQATIVPVDVFSPATTTGAVAGSSTNFQLLYQGLQYVAANPFVADPVRVGHQNRVVAAAIGFGTQQAFTTETEALQRFPQATVALKNALHNVRQAGIAPVAPAGEFGQPGTNVAGTTGTINGMSLPAIFNEVISVTGTYPFPIAPSATTTPLENFVGVIPRPAGPLLIFGGTNRPVPAGALALAAPDATIFKDKLVSAANRSPTTDYAAPVMDVPTFARTVAAAAGGPANASGNSPEHLTFSQAGTALSAAEVTGSFALVSSAINFWSQLATTGGGQTVNAYLTQPVGARSLNFGANGIVQLSNYANPDGINAILQWTAAPAVDNPAYYADGIVGVIPRPTTVSHTQQFPSYSRISVSNAVAAIEGTVALNYLIAHNDLGLIDANHDGLITAQEVQDFVDKAPTIGLPEAGAMARLLGGTARIPGTPTPTSAGENPDQPDVLQRRFNFFDYALNGRLTGTLSVAGLQQLSQRLLPTPDEFTIIDRQRASANGYLLAPANVRNIVTLQHRLPRFEFIPPSRIRRFRGISPQAFNVGAGQPPLANSPTFSLGALGGVAGGAAAGGGTTGSGTTGGGVTGASVSAATTTTAAQASTPAVTTTAPVTTASTTTTGSSTNASNSAAAILQAIQQIGKTEPASTSSPTSTATSGTPATTTVASQPVTGLTTPNSGFTGSTQTSSVATALGTPTPAGTVGAPVTQATTAAAQAAAAATHRATVRAQSQAAAQQLAQAKLQVAASKKSGNSASLGKMFESVTNLFHPKKKA